MRRLPASSVFGGPKLGKQGLPTEFRHQGITSYRVVEALEPLIIGSYQLRFVLLGASKRRMAASGSDARCATRKFFQVGIMVGYLDGHGLWLADA